MKRHGDRRPSRYDDRGGGGRYGGGGESYGDRYDDRPRYGDRSEGDRFGNFHSHVRYDDRGGGGGGYGRDRHDDRGGGRYGGGDHHNDRGWGYDDRGPPRSRSSGFGNLRNPPKKRRTGRDPSPPPRNPSNTALSNLSLGDPNRLIDQLRLQVNLQSQLVNSLKRENNGLVCKCDSLEWSVQILKSEGNWTYSAPDIPRSHWIEQGRDGDYAYSAERAVQSIKKATQCLRLDSGKSVDVGGGQQSPILYDSALDPHWKQLANAMQLSKCLTGLNLHSVQLDEQNLKRLETSLAQKGIARFSLFRNQFLGGEGVKFAIGVLKSNRSVKHFRWRQNTFRATEDACNLIDAILKHPTVYRLDVTGSLSNEDINAVQRLFDGVGNGTKLVSVDLSNSDIKTIGNRCIPGFLYRNPKLVKLIFKGNKLDDDDALAIAQALQSNTNLRTLDLGNNAMTAKGKAAVLSLAIFGIRSSDLSELYAVLRASLNTVSRANHTCEIRGIADGLSRTPIASLNNLMNRNNKSAKSNRGKKLLGLLLQRHRTCGNIISHLESYISKDCMGLVPYVLGYINTYSAGCFSLSELFEVVQVWKMPEMYRSRWTPPRH